jgi:acetylornithine deacetylase
MSDVVDLLAQLIRIDSSNPDLVSGAAGEGAIGDFIEQWFRSNDFEVHRLEKHSGRPSIVGISRGNGSGKSLMLNGHIDTVSLGSYEGNGLDPVINDGKMFGRGSFDMKGGIAAMMVAAKQAKLMGHSGDLLVACVADEEAASFGTEEVLEHFKSDAGLVIEPSYLQVTMSHKGFAWFDVVIHGRAAHGSRPELGIDAIAKAGHFLVALEEYAVTLAGKLDPILGPGTVHASLISGGEEASSYPAQCTITLERRTIPGETSESVQRELREILDSLTQSVSDFSYSLIPGLTRSSFKADPESEIARIAVRHLGSALGHEPLIRAEPFWTDCALLDQAGIPCLLFGVDGDGAHAASEWVTLESLEIVTETLKNIVMDYCR